MAEDLIYLIHPKFGDGRVAQSIEAAARDPEAEFKMKQKGKMHVQYSRQEFDYS